MLFVDVIRKKRDGGELSPEEIRLFVSGLADDSLPAEQVSALAMAVFLNSMTIAEAGTLTRAMAASGTILDWGSEDLAGPVIDKHSTGGIGDKVSFLLAPMAAACGCFVPMISGRGLGHGGGTLDKIGSIPGYNAMPDSHLFRRVVRSVGCAIIGQTADLAPADRRLYSIRDITGTVESVPLITASILSKKIAAGLDGLVMDVKFGSGAFMSSIEEAEELARSIIGTAADSGLVAHALLTDMNENLGLTAGNAVEVAEAMAFLTGVRREARLNEVVLGLVSEMLVIGELAPDRSAARDQAEAALASGKAAEVFGRMVAALGGPKDFVEKHGEYLPSAPLRLPVLPQVSGYLAAVDGRAVGNSIIELGGGRKQIGDQLDLAVGISEVAPIGAVVGADRPLAVIHAASDGDAQIAATMIRDACTVSEDKPAERPVIHETLTAG